MRPITCSLAVIFLITACARRPRIVDYDSRIGVAIQTQDRLCMAIGNANLLAGAELTLLAPSQNPHAARARVISLQAASCPGTKAATRLSNYNLELTNGTVPPGLPLIALDARVPSVEAAHSFHSCITADGVYLTAWDGAKPLEGHRLWRQYYYLGYDLEANCTQAETAP